jgi:hypothetical protein
VRAAKAAEASLAIAGIALIAAAVAANQQWLDRHFLPSFFLPRTWYVRIEWVVRGAFVAIGVAVALVYRARIARGIAGAARTIVPATLAALLALAAGEAALRFVVLRPTEWLRAEEEPRRQTDAELGWVLAPARTGRARIGGRTIEYAIDDAGYRVKSTSEPVDPARPTVVFAGESVMFGEGLAWDETIPAQVAGRIGIQSANLAVHGYSNDQAYLRLRHELPHFEQPVAVVSLFMTSLFGRNLDDDRPHLGAGLVWLPAMPAPRLAALASLLVPYRRATTVEQGILITRDVLRATVQLARDRGAAPLIVVPQFGGEDAADESLRRRVVSDDLPSVVITMDAGWRLPWDRHPNARASRAVAEAVVRRLEPQLQRFHR